MTTTFNINNEFAGTSVNTNNLINLNGGTLTVGAFAKTAADTLNTAGAITSTHRATINFNGTMLDVVWRRRDLAGLDRSDCPGAGWRGKNQRWWIQH